MKLSALQSHVETLHREAILNAKQRYNINNLRVVPIEFVPLLTSGGITVSKDTRLPKRIVLQQMYSAKGDPEIDDKYLAESEFTCLHESYHAAHLVGNPKRQDLFNQEREKIKRFVDYKRTPSFETFLILDEMTADFLAWQHIKEEGNLETFRKRMGGKIEASEKIVYDEVKRLSLEEAIETGRGLIFTQLEEIPQNQRLTFVKNYIENQLKMYCSSFAPPYQLGLFEGTV
jgi:hypothetical protein